MTDVQALMRGSNADMNRLLASKLMVETKAERGRGTRGEVFLMLNMFTPREWGELLDEGRRINAEKAFESLGSALAERGVIKKTKLGSVLASFVAKDAASKKKDGNGAGGGEEDGGAKEAEARAAEDAASSTFLTARLPDIV